MENIYYSLVPSSSITTFFRKSSIPFEDLCASRTLPNKESYEGGGAGNKSYNWQLNIHIIAFYICETTFHKFAYYNLKNFV